MNRKVIPTLGLPPAELQRQVDYLRERLNKAEGLLEDVRPLLESFAYGRTVDDGYAEGLARTTLNLMKKK